LRNIASPGTTADRAMAKENSLKKPPPRSSSDAFEKSL
jgi:hypothetical protein